MSRRSPTCYLVNSAHVQALNHFGLSFQCVHLTCNEKWFVIEARKLSDSLKSNNKNSDEEMKQEDLNSILKSLDAMGYDEAAQYVYGMDYKDWKKAHSKKATDNQMNKFNASKPMWATHNKDLLAKRSDEPGNDIKGVGAGSIGSKAAGTTSSTSLLSNVCCQDVDGPNPSSQDEPVLKKTKISTSRELPPFMPPAPPSMSFTLGILTISDRASANEYETGDLSGPAVLDAVDKYVAGTSGNHSIKMTSHHSCIVPDDMDHIQSKLRDWSDGDNKSLDLILTTGGTGFANRDVTPEATLQVIDHKCSGLVEFCIMECSKIQPLAALSRGIAGIRRSTLIVNLPGNPKGVQEIIPILLPLALHAISDLKHKK